MSGKGFGYYLKLGSAFYGYDIQFTKRGKMIYSLDDKVVIITGASAGIGRATAHAFAAAGCQVVLVARRAEVLTEVKAELIRYGKPVLAVPTDIVREDGVQALVRTVNQTFGRIDVLVNNAGLSRGGALQQAGPDQIHQMVELNVYAPMRLTQCVLPQMLKQKQGHIVNVSSVAGVVAAPGQVAYAATRAAVITFSHALRRELDGSGVRVSVVLPGWTRTAMLEKMPESDLRAAGLLNAWITLDPPEVPARAMVDAVRYNRYQVMLGGPQFFVGDIMHRISPRLMDLYYRWFVDKPKWLKILENLGGERSGL
jgi:NADP-dependent 3-hydroxy acid dehydrogenase YdfG